MVSTWASIVGSDVRENAEPVPAPETQPLSVEVEDLNFYYGERQVLFNISLKIPKNRVTALIGPSGCGKSTFLRTLNRMNDTIPGAKAVGKIMVEGQDIYTVPPRRG